jgi:transcriptional regulator with XRE-family HTH domain
VPNDSGVPGKAPLQVTCLIRECRTESSLTLEELAHRSGVPSSAISGYEDGAEAPSIGVLREIISATGHSACSTSGSLATDARTKTSLVPEAWQPGHAAEDEDPDEVDSPGSVVGEREVALQPIDPEYGDQVAFDKVPDAVGAYAQSPVTAP